MINSIQEYRTRISQALYANRKWGHRLVRVPPEDLAKLLDAHEKQDEPTRLLANLLNYPTHDPAFRRARTDAERYLGSLQQ